MPSLAEIAARTYVRAATERDPLTRARLLQSCFAEDGRMVTASRELRGRAAILQMFDRFHADPQLGHLRLTTAIDAGATIFRYEAVAEMKDGRRLHAFDAGEVDQNGQIVLILTFASALAAAPDGGGAPG